MTGTIGGVDNYSYAYRLLQAQGSNSAGGASLGKISANGKGSVNEDEQAAFESALTTQLQSVPGGSGSDSLSSLLSLLNSSAQTAATSTTSNAANSNSDASSQAATSGSASTAKSDFAALQSNILAQLLAPTTSDDESAPSKNRSTAGVFVEQAIQKYMMMSPAGQAASAAGSLLGLG